MMTFGKYTVKLGLRADNPAFPVYIVYAGGKEIGRSFSMPDRGCCEWLHRQKHGCVVYAAESAKLPRYAPRGVAVDQSKRGKQTKEARAARQPA